MRRTFFDRLCETVGLYVIVGGGMTGAYALLFFALYGHWPAWK